MEGDRHHEYIILFIELLNCLMLRPWQQKLFMCKSP